MEVHMSDEYSPIVVADLQSPVRRYLWNNSELRREDTDMLSHDDTMLNGDQTGEDFQEHLICAGSTRARVLPGMVIFQGTLPHSATAVVPEGQQARARPRR